jgi:hypothetical protein
MNWDAIGAIAELLGAVGVIASLVYLATQIRHSREQMRAVNAQQFQAQVSSTAQAMVRDGELARLVLRGNQSLDQLEEDERLRFGLYIYGILTEYESAYYQYRVGLLDLDRWQQNRSQLRSIFRPPGITSWWADEMDASNFSPEFVALVEEILGEEAEGAQR